MSRYDKFLKRGKCIHGHCSKMSNAPWTDLNCNNTILKLHDMCPNKNCNCQKLLSLLLINICLKAVRLNLN